MASTTVEVDEGAMLEDAVRVLLRSGFPLGMAFRADAPPSGSPQWATPVTFRSEMTGREWMLEVKAVECTDWNQEK